MQNRAASIEQDQRHRARSKTQDQQPADLSRLSIKRCCAPAWYSCKCCDLAKHPGGSVHGERANFTELLLGCIEAIVPQICPLWCFLFVFPIFAGGRERKKGVPWASKFVLVYLGQIDELLVRAEHSRWHTRHHLNQEHTEAEYLFLVRSIPFYRD